MDSTPHPLISQIPPDAMQSIEGVGRWIAEHEPDPYQRVKALHDFTAIHVDYDYDSLVPGQRKPQGAQAVFDSGIGVCAGYANLMVALGRASGDEIVYLTGDTRMQDGAMAGSSHAWNAVRIGANWYLIDTTWDAGFQGDDGSFTQRYQADYLLTPPTVFRQDHLPKEPRWQLVAPPMDRGDFTRQLMLQPGFYADGLTLTSPTRSQVSVVDKLEIIINNPRGVSITAKWEDSNGHEHRCRVEEHIVCRFPQKDTYRITLFTAPRGDMTLWSVGQLEVNADPNGPGAS